MASNLQAIESLYQNEIEVYKNQVEELRQQNRSKDEKNATLIDKVQTLNDLIEKANVTNKDLYTAFEHVREENLKLQSYTNPQENVSSNIEEENELALDNVKRQYINLARESASWISDKDRLTQRIKFLERECERYTRDNLTLGKQVRHLLKALEEERGMIIRRPEPAVKDPTKPVTALDVIDDHLVTFQSIEELQRQNQKLLSLVKELSKKEEEQEPQVESDEARELNEEIAALKSQLEVVKVDREKIMNAFNTLHKERDLFKILLCKTREVEHMTPEIFQRMVSIACSSGPAITLEPENTNEKDLQIAELKESMSKVEQGLSDLREEYEKVRVESARELKLKSDLLEQSHMKILTESQQVETLRERNQLLESNAKALLNEFDEARTKMQKLTFELESKNELLDQANQNYKAAAQKVQSLREEYQTLESEHKDLMYELDEAKAKHQNMIYELESKTDMIDQLNKKFNSETQKVLSLREAYQNLESNKLELMYELNDIKAKMQNMTSELESHRAQESHNKLYRLMIKELQRLRNLERSGRLELSKKLHVLESSSKVTAAPVEVRLAEAQPVKPSPVEVAPVEIVSTKAPTVVIPPSEVICQVTPKIEVKMDPEIVQETTQVPAQITAQVPAQVPAQITNQEVSSEMPLEAIPEVAPAEVRPADAPPAQGIQLKRRKITISRKAPN